MATPANPSISPEKMNPTSTRAPTPAAVAPKPLTVEEGKELLAKGKSALMGKKAEMFGLSSAAEEQAMKDEELDHLLNEETLRSLRADTAQVFSTVVQSDYESGGHSLKDRLRKMR
jgi:hypothetical protein